MAQSVLSLLTVHVVPAALCRLPSQTGCLDSPHGCFGTLSGDLGCDNQGGPSGAQQTGSGECHVGRAPARDSGLQGPAPPARSRRPACSEPDAACFGTLAPVTERPQAASLVPVERSDVQFGALLRAWPLLGSSCGPDRGSRWRRDAHSTKRWLRTATWRSFSYLACMTGSYTDVLFFSDVC